MAVIASLVMPAVCTLFIIPIKYNDQHLHIDSVDFTAGYWFFAALAAQIAAVVIFTRDDFHFDWHKWITGSIASLFNLLGTMFAIAAYSTGNPIAPMNALMNG